MQPGAPQVLRPRHGPRCWSSRRATGRCRAGAPVSRSSARCLALGEGMETHEKPWKNSWKTMEKPWKNHETTIIFSSRIWEWWGFTGKISGLKRAIKYEDLRFAIGICQAKQIEHLKNVGIYLHYLNDVCFSSATYGCQEYVTCWCAT